MLIYFLFHPSIKKSWIWSHRANTDPILTQYWPNTGQYWPKHKKVFNSIIPYPLLIPSIVNHSGWIEDNCGQNWLIRKLDLYYLNGIMRQHRRQITFPFLWILSLKYFLKKRRYDRRSSNCNLRNYKLTRKSFGTSSRFESMASALALQCFNNWAMKTHTLGAGQQWLTDLFYSSWFQIFSYSAVNCKNANTYKCVNRN